MNRTSKFVALAAAASLGLAGCAADATPEATSTGSTSGGSSSTGCETVTEVTMLGTIKGEINSQFEDAVGEYNSSQDCYELVIIPENSQAGSFLADVLPKYAAGEAPVIMTALQEIPDMADKVMDFTGTDLMALASPGLLAGANVGGKQVGLPVTAEAFGLVYNKDVLDAAGVDPLSITTRDELEAAFQAVEASGVDAIRFSALWWSLGAHLTNKYFTMTSDDREERLQVLDQLADGTKDLASDPVFQNWLDTFDLMKNYMSGEPNVTDTEYDDAGLATALGEVGFWFMGNWSEPSLLTNNPEGTFGLMPLPISNDAASYGNDAISVGVPFYFMVDEEQSTEEERAGAMDFLEWLITTPEGQLRYAGPIEDGYMNFIPVYSGFTVEPNTFMAQEIATYVNAGKTLEWMNSYYPAGGQNLYGDSGQKLITGAITGAEYAAEIEAAWLGEPKTWRGESAE